MHDNRTHPLLEQVPLTVSPFVQLPRATTLPYTYKAMPSALPPSTLGIGAADSNTSKDDPTASSSLSSNPAAGAPAKPKFVVSASGGHAAHPDDILASCQALHAHLDRMRATAAADLSALEDRIRTRELAEKRRVAPGWLDSDARLLQPERRDGDGGADGGVDLLGAMVMGAGSSSGKDTSASPAAHGYVYGHGTETGGACEMAVPDDDEGAELDRAFGSMALGPR